MKIVRISLMLFALMVLGGQYNISAACTRVVYQGPNNTIITGRTMDWKEDSRSNLWIFPRGMERSGEVGKDPMKWTSKYGSVVTAAYDICSTDGMNEVGLVANLLWLAESEYPAWDGKRPGLSIAAWVQYMLDNFATVDETVAAIGVFSVIRNTSVPYGISTPNEPNISSTIWRTVADQKDKVYFFESTLYPNIFWVNFKDVDFSVGAPVKKLDLVSGKTYAGNTASQFVESKPFKFLGID